MSSSCTLELAGYPIAETKCYPVPELMVFFRERDRQVFPRKIVDRNPLVWGTCDEGSEEIAFTYSVNIHDFKSRMDLLGFTLEKTKADFQASKLNQLELMNDANHGLTELLYDTDIDTLERASFEEFLVAFRTIRDRRVSGIPCESVIQCADSPLIKRLFWNNYESFDFFPCDDLRSSSALLRRLVLNTLLLHTN